jgi:hypothetical protein
MRSCLENTQHEKGLAEWLKWYSVSLANLRSVQAVVLLKITTTKRKKKERKFKQK